MKLQQAAKEYADKQDSCDWSFYHKAALDDFTAGANWNKDQVVKIIEEMMKELDNEPVRNTLYYYKNNGSYESLSGLLAKLKEDNNEK